MADKGLTGFDYGVKDANGNWVGSLDPTEKNARGNYKWKEGQQVYSFTKDGRTTFVERKEDIPTWVDLNESTGKITVSAPDVVLNSDSYKNTMKPLLTQLSSVYKSNKDYKMPNPFDSNDKKTDYTVKEVVKMIQDGINKNQMSLGSYYRAEDQFNEVFGEKAKGRFSPSLYYILGANGASGKDDDIIAIPKSITENYRWSFLKDSDTFSNDTMTVKGFNDIYYHSDFFRDVFGNNNPHELKEYVKERLAAMQQVGIENLSDEDLKEYMRLQAFGSYLGSTEPSKDIINSFIEQIWGVGEFALRATADFASGISSVADGIWNRIISIGGTDTDIYKVLSDPTSKLATLGSTVVANAISLPFTGTFISYDDMLTTDTVSSELRKQYDERAQFYIDTNRDAATWGMLSYMGTKVFENIVAGRAISSVMLGALGRVAAIKHFDKLQAAVFEQAGFTKDVPATIGLANGAGVMSTGVMSGTEMMNKAITGVANPSMFQLISGLSNVDVSSVWNFTKFTTGLAAMTDDAKTFAAAINSLNTTNKILSVGSKVITLADLIAQTTFDTALQDPVAARKLIEGSGTDEERAILWENAAWNASGYAAGLVLGRMISAFPKTATGKAVNEAATRKLWQLEGWISNQRDSVKMKMFGDDFLSGIKNPGKKQVAYYRYVINKAGQDIANSSGDVASTLAGNSAAKGTKEAIRHMRAVDNAISQRMSGMSVKLREYMSDAHPLINNSVTTLRNETTELAKMLTDNGYPEVKADSSILIGNAIDPTMGINQEINNYVGNLIQKRILDNKLLKNKTVVTSEGGKFEIPGSANFTPEQKRAYPKLSEKIASAEEKFPKVVTDYIKEHYIPALYSAGSSIRKYRMSPKVGLDIEQEIQGYISTGMWGEKGDEYVPMMRIPEAQKAFVDAKNGMSQTIKTGFIRNRNNNPEKIQWGSEADFINPTLAVERYLIQTAYDEINQTLLRENLKTAGIKNVTLFDGTKTGAARTFDNLEPALDKAVKEGLREVKVSFDSNYIANMITNEYINKSNIEKAEAAQKRATKEIESLKTKDIKVSAVDRAYALLSMSPDNVENVLNDAFNERAKGKGTLNDYDKIATIEDALNDADTWNKFILNSPIGVRRAIKRAVDSYSDVVGLSIDEISVDNDIYNVPFISYDDIVSSHLTGKMPSEESLDALRQYQSSDSGISAEIVNKFLINGRKNPKVDDLINRLQDAFTRELDTDVVLFSGENNPKQIKNLIDNLGKKSTLLGFTSTSTDFDYAKTFADNDSGYVLRIYTPSGTKIAVMPENIAGANGELENEILLKKGLDVVVENVHEAGDISDKGVIDLRIIDSSVPSDIVELSLPDNVDEINALITPTEKTYLSAPVDDPSLKYDAYKLVSEINPDTINDINKAMIKANKEVFNNSDLITKIAKEQKKARIELAATTRLTNAKKTLEMPTLNTRMEFIETIDSGINEIRDSILNDENAVKVLDAIMVSNQGVDTDVARNYVTMVYIKNHKKEILQSAKDVFEYGKFKTIAGKMPGTQIAKIQNYMLKEIERHIDELLDNARNVFVAEGGEVVDGDKVLKEIHQLMDDIEEASHDANVVDLRQNGESVLVETDPIVANLANYHVIDNYSTFEKTLSNPVIRGMNRMARFFQVTVSPKSMRNQYIRDPLAMFLGTGALPIRDGMKHISQELLAKYDEELVKQYQQMWPEDYKVLKEQAEKDGKNLSELVINSIMAYGTSTSPAVTQTAYYRDPFADINVSENFWGQIEKTKKTINKIVKKAGDATDAAHQAREVYLRNADFAKGLKDGLDAGMSLEDAMNMAQFFRDNGTTNFRNQLYHLRALAGTVNYFGAAINGYTSFWRLFSLDPVGVSTRLFGGLVIPVIVATAWSLASDENRERYKGIKEYEKNEQFIFVMNGQVYRVPIPQELSVIVNPIRHAVEALFDGNKHSFWELMLTDMLNMGPVKLGDLMDIDRNEFAGDPTILDRMGQLGLSLIDQTMPLVLKTIFTFATGIDTYTGQPIDTSYYSFDEDGNRILIGGTQSEFSLKLGKATGWSPSVIAWTTKNLFGTVGRDILDVVIGGDNPGSLVTNTLSDISLTASDYDRSASDWNKMIADLWNQKEGKYLQEWNDYTDQINKENDPEKKEKLKNNRKDAIQPFLSQVQNMVKALNEKYPGMYDRYRFASVVSLLNFDSGSASGTDAAAQERDLQNFYANRNQAYQWMTDLGISGSDSGSILGHLERDKNGNTVVKINNPLEILSAQSLFYGASDQHLANITTIIESGTDSLKNQKKAVANKITEIYNKGNLTQADYDEIDDIKIDWDKKVIAALTPYVQQVTPEAAINNEEVLNYLRKYIYVPDAWKVNNKGYHVTNKSLNYLGSAEDAFADSFIKYVFGVNDKRYDTGWNFSGNKTLGGK